MFNDLQGLGYGLVIFAIVIGVGSIVLANFASSVATCNTSSPYNATSQNCMYPGNGSDTFSSGQATTNLNYNLTQLGSGGLAGWTPAIIAISVGLLFLGAFAIGQGRKGRY